MNEYNEAMASEYSYEYWLSRHDLHNDCSMSDCVECVRESEAMESKKGSEFGIEWDLILDSQSVAEILAKFSIYDDDISAVMVKFDSVGDIVEIWITESNAPYLLTSEYMPIDYWRNE